MIKRFWVGPLLISLAFIFSPTRANDLPRSPKQLCDVAPNWNGEYVAYSNDLEKSGVAITYQEWSSLFKSKIVYDYKRAKFVLSIGLNKTAEKYVGQPAAYVVGKVPLSGKISGLLVLEQSDNAKTGVCLYPVLDDGTPLRGLVLADEWDNENDEINIKGKIIHPDSGTAAAKILFDTTEYDADTGDVITNNAPVTYIFPFDEREGFVYFK
jgi:hypothetical protein